MTIEVLIRGPWLEEWNTLTVEGEQEYAIASVAIAALLMAKYEVEVIDSDGDQVPYLEWDHE